MQMQYDGLQSQNLGACEASKRAGTGAAFGCLASSPAAMHEKPAHSFSFLTSWRPVGLCSSKKKKKRKGNKTQARRNKIITAS